MKFDIDYRQLPIEHNYKLKFEKTEHGFVLKERTGIVIINAWNIEEDGTFVVNEIEPERKPGCLTVNVNKNYRNQFVFRIEE
jgi:hypothetical protein